MASGDVSPVEARNISREKPARLLDVTGCLFSPVGFICGAREGDGVLCR